MDASIVARSLNSSATSNKQKRVAIFFFSLSGGGTQRIMVCLANAFYDLEFLVDLVFVSAEGPYISLVNDKVRIIDLKSPRVIASLPNLVRYLRVEKPHVLLSTLSYANLVLFIAKILSRNPGKNVVRVANNCRFAAF